METKKWYLSKTIWSDIVTVAMALYGLVAGHLAPDLGFHMKPIPAFLLTLLGALGIYGRTTATTEIDTGNV